MNETFSLYRLQQLDTQRIQRLKRIKQIDQIVASDKAVLKAQAIVQRAADALTESDNTLEELRKNVEEKTLKLKLTQAKLFGGKISATKELQDLQAESEALRRTIKTLEDEQMKLLEGNELCQAQRKKLRVICSSYSTEKPLRIPFCSVNEKN
jgi:predicted  nucleic acid-binding Zn-ribbon protein